VRPLHPNSVRPPSGAEPTVDVPRRPNDLRLDAPACGLLTKALLSQLEITDPPQPKTSGGYFKAPGCDFEIATLESLGSFPRLVLARRGAAASLAVLRTAGATLVDPHEGAVTH
jgi:hypothetical protein